MLNPADSPAAARLSQVETAIARAAATRRPQARRHHTGGDQQDLGGRRDHAADRRRATPVSAKIALPRQRPNGRPCAPTTPDITLHLVGQLQSNKAESAVALFDVIHSVDRPSLITALGKAMHAAGQISGLLHPGQYRRRSRKRAAAPLPIPAPSWLRHAPPGLPVVGLMAVPPADIEAAPFFALLAKLARRARTCRAQHGHVGRL